MAGTTIHETKNHVLGLRQVMSLLPSNSRPGQHAAKSQHAKTMGSSLQKLAATAKEHLL